MMVQMPAPTMCTVSPLTVQVLDVSDLKATGRFEVAVALTRKSWAPIALSPNAPKVTVWPALAPPRAPAAVSAWRVRGGRRAHPEVLGTNSLGAQRPEGDRLARLGDRQVAGAVRALVAGVRGEARLHAAGIRARVDASAGCRRTRR